MAATPADITEANDEEIAEVNDWISEDGYANLSEWLEDSDYRLAGSVWLDEHGYVVDPYGVALAAKEAAEDA